MISREKTTDKQGRNTSLLVAAVAALIAGFFWYRERPSVAMVVASIALILAVIGLFIPPAANLFHRGWMKFAFVLGYVNSRILLTLIYFFVFVPYGIISHIFGRDPLSLREGGKDSYWRKREVTRQPKEQFKRLF